MASRVRPPARFEALLMKWHSAMAKRHWLDPLARQLLRATGQIPPAQIPPDQLPAAPADAAAERERERVQRELVEQELVEQELLALKLQHNPASGLKMLRPWAGPLPWAGGLM